MTAHDSDLWQPPHRAYGKISGVVQRMADWVGKLKYDKSTPWVGLGVLADWELIVRLLSLEEFGQWLHTHSDDQLQRWGVEVLDAAQQRDALLATIDEHLPDGGTATAAVETAGTQLDAIRAVLVECGALQPGDRDTDPAALIRALLS